jgi:tetratricopeptide (TPR) repeat protein
MPVDMPMQGNPMQQDNPMQKGAMPGPVNMDTQQAIVKMEEMLKSEPNNVQLIVHLGNLYFDTNNPQKAVDTYEKALVIDRKNADVLTDCGVMYRALKKYDKALAYFKEATQVEPTHFQSWYNMGIVYREDLKQYQKAIDTWNQLLVKIPNSEHAAQVQADIQKTKDLM